MIYNKKIDPLKVIFRIFFLVLAWIIIFVLFFIIWVIYNSYISSINPWSFEAKQAYREKIIDDLALHVSENYINAYTWDYDAIEFKDNAMIYYSYKKTKTLHKQPSLLSSAKEVFRIDVSDKNTLKTDDEGLLFSWTQNVKKRIDSGRCYDIYFRRKKLLWYYGSPLQFIYNPSGMDFPNNCYGDTRQSIWNWYRPKK